MRSHVHAGVGILAGAILAGCGGSDPASVKTGLRDWQAEPAMISNAGVYRTGEFVWQDYIYDDRGANTDGRDRFDAPLGTPGPDPNDPVNPRLSPAPLVNTAGDFTYASPDGTHMANVADLIEFRVAADEGSVYYRIRLGDMTTPDSAVVALCVDEDGSIGSGLIAWPFGAGFAAQLGCEHLYTVYGTAAQVTDAAGETRDLAALGGAVGADVNEALLELRVPRTVADPAKGRWRYYVASGVWDAASGSWAAPLAIPAQAGLPVASGGGPLVPAIWDLLSNNMEPNSTHNEEKQANDLTAHYLVDHYLDVDFARLAEPRDDPDPERTGVVVRIYHSQYPMAVARGLDLDGTNTVYNGPWQPYTAVIPSTYYQHPDKQYPFDFCMHPLGANHNVEVFYAEAFARRDYNPVVTGVFPSTGYLGFTQITSLIDRLDAVYACVLGRGEGVGYQGGDGMVDAIEVQADMERRYRVDPDRRTVHGVSLGAIGTWYLSRLYPDRYSAAMPYIFTTDLATGGIEPTPTLANLYNLPVFYALGTLDQFGQGPSGDPLADQLTEFGNEFVYLHYLLRQHEGRIEQDFLPFLDKLAYSRIRVENPAVVHYVLDPAMFSAKVPPTGSAYWVTGMKLREGAATGLVYAQALPLADQLPTHHVVFDGLYANPDKLYSARIRGLLRMTQAEFEALWEPEVWEPGWTELQLTVTETDLPVPEPSNQFFVLADGLSTITLDARRMGLEPGAIYAVHTDGPLEVRFTDGRVLHLPEAGQYGGEL